MTKLAEIKNNIVENMTSEIKHASKYCWEYMYVNQNEKLYSKWNRYRRELYQYRAWVASMDCEDFARMLHHNVNELQIVAFGHN